ncbi:MAG: helix-turn-helix domain-containing protein [Terriglobales bacterium]
MNDKWIEGSGNVFVDVGFDPPEAEMLLLKSYLLDKLQDAVAASNQTQVQLAKRLGTDQSKISKIKRGKITEFSLDRIIMYLIGLGWNVRVLLREEKDKSACGRTSLGVWKDPPARAPKTKTRSAKPAVRKPRTAKRA